MNSTSIVNLKIKENNIEDFLVLITNHAKNCLKIEENCLNFFVSQQKDSKSNIWLYEVYTDEASHKSHRESSHMKKFIENAGHMISEKTIIESFSK